MKKSTGFLALFLGAMLVIPFATGAFSGTNAKEITVKVDAKQGGEWLRAIEKKTDEDGVLTLTNALPGWYRLKVPSDDEKSGQTIAVKFRMLDNDGRRLKEETTVEKYVKVGDAKVSLGTAETDEDGWLKLSGLSEDTEYKLEIDEDDNSHISKRDNTSRVKIKAKIKTDRGYTDWFPAIYKRTEEGHILKTKNALPGKYKFKYKTGDRDPGLPFTLQIRLNNEDGEDLDEPTKVTLYAYIAKVRTPVGELMTDEDGWVTIPGVMTNMTYKIKVQD